MCTLCLTNTVELNRGKKSREAASDKHFNKNAVPESPSHARAKKIPGLILNSVNDTGLSEFLAQKVVCLAERYFLPDA
ncbi:hypothetical protein C3400_19060 [Klebsiella oxytoca]|nr:hypothetical protein C2U46_21325 [Klebsiella oxytoca]AVE78082.1 hypothetical protein AM355_13090 [Klebsiella oxytoca]POT62181.1 hypothetical protein C3412_28350 [Klebsiella oxytoca]POT82947.1 hypothetical protein C3416_28345 [Klebsiella oxytoca]POU93127.1 hypothetical protein C3400_19060 [Klebsiella oxytoca]